MQLISKFRFLLCVNDIFSKYAWIVPLKDKKKKKDKSVTTVNAFQKILDDLNRSEAKAKECKPNKIWVDKGSEFYSNSLKKWLRDIDIEMNPVHNKGKSIAAERFIRTLKIKIYKNMTLVSKNVYINKLDDIVGEYNNTYQRTIKMTPVMKKNCRRLINKNLG